MRNVSCDYESGTLGPPSKDGGTLTTLSLGFAFLIVQFFIFTGLKYKFDHGHVSLTAGSKWWQFKIFSIFRIRFQAIQAQCGPDAARFLSFQMALLFVLGLYTLYSVPIGFSGNLLGGWEPGQYTFYHSTITNLDPEKWYAWLYIIVPMMFVPAIVVSFRHFLDHIPAQSGLSRTVMILGIPKNRCDTMSIRRHFREAYPRFGIAEIKIAFKISKLLDLEEKRRLTLEAKLVCESEANKGNAIWIRTCCCGRDSCCSPCCIPCSSRCSSCCSSCCCSCCSSGCCNSLQGALPYYTNQDERFTSRVEAEKIKALEQPVGVAFVTFTSPAHAFKVCADHKRNWRRRSYPGLSSLSAELNPNRWTVKLAPPAMDINWENLEVPTWSVYFRAFTFYGFLVIGLCCLVLPAIFIPTMDYYHFMLNMTDRMPKLLLTVVPVMVLKVAIWIITILMSFSKEVCRFHTKSAANLLNMWMTYFFQFLFLIVPALGLTTAKVLLKWSKSSGEDLKIECIFLPENGAFFANFIIMSWLSGTASDLLRPSDLFKIAWSYTCAKSKAELPSIRREPGEFDYGAEYAAIMLNFTITIIYSFAVPYISIFGWLYLLFKYWVDRHNLYFTCSRTRINKNIHASAVVMVHMACYTLQLALFVFFLLRLGVGPIPVFALIALSCSILASLLLTPLINWLCNLRLFSISSSSKKLDSSDSTEIPSTYVHPILKDVSIDCPLQSLQESEL